MRGFLVLLCFSVCTAVLLDKNLARIENVLLSTVSNLEEASANAAGLVALGVAVPKVSAFFFFWLVAFFATWAHNIWTELV